MSLLETLRAKLTAALENRSAQAAAVEAVLAPAEAEKRSNLTPEETVAFDEARKALDPIDAEIADLRSTIAIHEDLNLRAASAAKLSGSFEPAAVKQEIRVGREELTYRQGGAHSFMQDAYRSQFSGDFSASERLQRHSQEMDVELRATGTSSFTTGLVVPQFLTSLYAPAARAGRPLADALGSEALPDEGMSISVARVTTKTAVAVQASENVAVQSTDLAATLLTVPVNTYAGQQDISRQAIDRGTGVDGIVVRDLLADYGVQIDNAIINGAGTGGTHLGFLSTSGISAVTASTATVAGIFPKIADAIQRVNTLRFMPADLIVMHPRRWAFFLAAVDTAGRPLVTPKASYGAFNSMSAPDVPNAAMGVVGTLLGVDVVLDANIPTNLGAGTNEDRIIVTYKADHILWEQPSSPLSLRFEQTLGNQLTVKVVVYGYSAFTAGRYPAAVSVISGVGLVPPTF